MNVRQIRAVLIVATLAMLVGAFVSRSQAWSIGLAGVSGAIAAYATIMIITLALAFSKTVKEVGDSDGTGVTFGRVMGLLLAYPIYRDLEVLNSDRQVVAGDVINADFPRLRFTPVESGDYQIRVILKTCVLAPCYVGARLLQ